MHAQGHMRGCTHAPVITRARTAAADVRLCGTRLGRMVSDLSEILARAQVVDQLRELRDEAAPELRLLPVRDRRETCTCVSQRLSRLLPVSTQSTLRWASLP